jgi:hypothetical protein
MNAEKLTPLQRARVAQLDIQSHDTYVAMFDRLDESLGELQHLFGWSFDSKLLGSVFTSRCVLRDIQALDLNERHSEKDVCEVFSRAHIQCTNVIQGLLGLLGY